METVLVEQPAEPKAKPVRKPAEPAYRREELEDLAGGWDSELDDILNELGAN